MKQTISGTPLLGFAEVFDAVSGDPETESPYPVVTPSAMGPVLLPFACPHCQCSCAAVVDPARRRDYFDRERKFSWCPTCRKRFFVDRKGQPLTVTLVAGAEVAPAAVEYPPVKRSEVLALGASWVDVEVRGLDVLGAV